MATVTQLHGEEILPEEGGREATLAARYYTEGGVMQAEIRDLLYKLWQFICHDSEVAEPGDFFAFDLHGQSYFLVRTAEMRWHRCIAQRCQWF